MLRLHRVLSLAFVALGTVFVRDFRPTGAPPPPRLLLPDPALATAAVGGLLLVLALAPQRLFRSLRARHAVWTALAAAGLLLGTLWLGGELEDAFLSVLVLLSAPVLATTLWSRGRGDARPLAAGTSVLLVGLAVFGVELSGSDHGAPVSAYWGLSETFATEFPRQPPYIGAGGRLRPGLDLYMVSRDRPQGSRLVTDSHGFRNAEEVRPRPAEGTLRVLNLGDSFSIGMQIDQRDFLGTRLERELERRTGRPVQVVNAEVSDPAYGLWWFQEFGAALGARLVLFGLCANDLMQVDDSFGPGRLFRLDDHGTLVAAPGLPRGEGHVARYAALAYPRPAPHGVPARRSSASGEPDAAQRLLAKLLRLRLVRWLLPAQERRTDPPSVLHSYATAWEEADGRMRYFDGTANLGTFAAPPLPVLDELYGKLMDVLGALDAGVTASGGRLVVLIHPQRFQVHPADWQAIVDGWGLDPGDFDLEAHDRRLTRLCAERGLSCLDLLAAFRAAADQGPLYLADGDMHYDRAGHALAAGAVADMLCERLPEALAPAASEPAAEHEQR